MKQFLLIIALLAEVTSGFGQSKPPKEEIVMWLTEKIKRYGKAIKDYEKGSVISASGAIRCGDVDPIVDPEYAAVHWLDQAKYIDVNFDNICGIQNLLISVGPVVTFRLKLMNPVSQQVKTWNNEQKDWGPISRGTATIYTADVIFDKSDGNQAEFIVRLRNAFNDLGSYNCPKVKETY